MQILNKDYKGIQIIYFAFLANFFALFAWKKIIGFEFFDTVQLHIKCIFHAETAKNLHAKIVMVSKFKIFK